MTAPPPPPPSGAVPADGAAGYVRPWMVALFWAAAASFQAAQFVAYVVFHMYPPGATPLRIALVYGGIAAVGIAATPLLLGTARRFPFRRGGRLAAFAAHALLVFALAAVTLWVRWRWLPRYSPSYLRFALFNLYQFLFVFCAAAGLAHAVRRLAELRRREVQEAALQRDLAAARTEAMRRRVEPELLFAALDDAARMVRRDPDGADRLIAALGGHLRAKATAADLPLVPLRAELAVAEAWTEVRAARAPGLPSPRLDVRADEALMEAPVPPFVLQPLVEQALASAGSASRGDVRVTAAREGGRLRLEVLGTLAPAGDGAWSAAALEPLQARLAELYGGDHSLEAGTGADGRAFALLRVPLPAFA